MTTNTDVTVRLLVHHGDYRAEFFGTGATVMDAAQAAAAQTSYAKDLFTLDSGFYQARQKFRDELSYALENYEEYRGYGWNTFSVVQ